MHPSDSHDCCCSGKLNRGLVVVFKHRLQPRQRFRTVDLPECARGSGADHPAIVAKCVDKFGNGLLCMIGSQQLRTNCLDRRRIVLGVVLYEGNAYRKRTQKRAARLIDADHRELFGVVDSLLGVIYFSLNDPGTRLAGAIQHLIENVAAALVAHPPHACAAAKSTWAESSSSAFLSRGIAIRAFMVPSEVTARTRIVTSRSSRPDSINPIASGSYFKMVREIGRAS